VDDDSKLLQHVEDLRKGVGTILGHLGPPGFGDSAGMAVRLKLSHEELKLIRISVQRIGLGVFVIVVAVVASVWHHW
jgi:hypothetical protein